MLQALEYYSDWIWTLVLASVNSRYYIIYLLYIKSGLHLGALITESILLFIDCANSSKNFIIQCSSSFFQSLYHAFLNHIIITSKGSNFKEAFADPFFKMPPNMVEIWEIGRPIHHFNCIISKSSLDNVCYMY